MAKKEKRVPKKESKLSDSVATERTKRAQAIEELGRKIIEELDDRDITAKWMAAYLSELMIASRENATLKQEIPELILELWRERRHFPGNDPMQRYEKALAAMELLLSTGDPVFQVWMPSRVPSEPDRDKIGLARKLKHHSGSLVEQVVKAVVKETDLDQDQLADIAEIADPDAETRFLNVLKIVVYDEETEEAHSDPYFEIREEISVLRQTLDVLEAALQSAN